jgi:hypothetical protein
MSITLPFPTPWLRNIVRALSPTSLAWTKHLRLTENSDSGPFF